MKIIFFIIILITILSYIFSYPVKIKQNEIKKIKEVIVKPPFCNWCG